MSPRWAVVCQYKSFTSTPKCVRGLRIGGTYTMVPLRIRIRAHNIHIRVPRVPIRRHRVPHPDEVLQPVHARQSVEDKLVQLLRRLGAFGAPLSLHQHGLIS